MNIKLFIIVLIVYLIIDSIWLSSSVNSVYRPVIKAVQNSDIKFNMLGAAAAYLLLALGVYYFVLEEGYQSNKKKLIIRAALFGLMGYGIFNGTNNAIFVNWNYRVCIIDTLWGITGSILVSYISNHINGLKF